jgi:hypothetical protein
MSVESELLFVERVNLKGAVSGDEWLEHWRALPALQDADGAAYELDREPLEYFAVGDPPAHRVDELLACWWVEQPVESAALDASWPHEVALADAVESVRATYRVIGGRVRWTDLLYVTRWNLPVEEEPAWEERYPREHKLGEEQSREGLGRAMMTKRVDEPTYVGWSGPSHGAKYLNIFEIVDEAAVDLAMRPRDEVNRERTTDEAPRAPYPWLSGSRNVYRRLT